MLNDIWPHGYIWSKVFLRLELVCSTVDFPVQDTIISERVDVAAGVC